MMHTDLKSHSLDTSDLSQALKIEQSVQISPWSIQQLESSLAQHFSLGIYKEQLLAYIIWQEVHDEAEILTLATSPDYQRQGLACYLLTEFFKRLKKNGVKKIYLEVATSNQAALSLYQKQGFKKVGERKNYYTDKHGKLHNAWIFTRDV